MSLREFLLENFAGDLQYHPRLAAVYVFLGIASGSYWIFAPSASKLTATPIVFALGGLMLVAKSVLLFRPSSEGIGLSLQEVEALRATGYKKGFLPFPALAAQIVQDFGAGGVLLCPLVPSRQSIDGPSYTTLRFAVFLSGLVLFGLGWVIRRLTSPSAESGPGDYK